MPSSIALVTGATLGIGRAAAFALGRAGYTFGVCARDPARVDGLVRDLRAEGIESAGGAADVGNPADVKALRAGPCTWLRNTRCWASAGTLMLENSML